MKENRRILLFGLLGIALVIITPLALLWPGSAEAGRDPWEQVVERLAETDHSPLLTGPFETPQEVTAACLECHPDAAGQVMETSHWTWTSKPTGVDWAEEPVSVGKANAGNNFCIGIQGNWARCTACHIGYGWEDENFDFENPENVDCLACHADIDVYIKGESGMPAEGVDLAAAAQTVAGPPTRDNCGSCHFNGGGGNGVKHGDLDESLYFPSEDLDIHMGGYDLLCIDCHTTKDHQVTGRSLSYALDASNQVYCTDCHDAEPHDDARINSHLTAVACQTCHVPMTALKDPTKVFWDWSTVGQEGREDDHFTYLKIKGSFIYEDGYLPEYSWWNGQVTYRYQWGDVIDPNGIPQFNPPDGDIFDPAAMIWPFKVHRSNMPFDPVNNILLQPVTSGAGGLWETFDWTSALQLGSEIVGIPFSGSYDFIQTEFYYPQTHMVQTGERALQCASCHGEDGRLDWRALGYPGDPIDWGGRPVSP